ncbi:alpha-1,2-Mannosidase [Chloropicon primus]|uniref:alpha-1,2-Mannosidase n=1 Tax=Chloropicon primus TaxID=1764295 RepID=A0A5B8MMK2_9CHLO|nr:alpha-1,2-Mannosidase [Chloropicon primus]|eukprot:QDZ21689.1 alpha-1,2-Mannosidase [Chloropicon primus]
MKAMDGKVLPRSRRSPGWRFLGGGVVNPFLFFGLVLALAAVFYMSEAIIDHRTIELQNESEKEQLFVKINELQETLKKEREVARRKVEASAEKTEHLEEVLRSTSTEALPPMKILPRNGIGAVQVRERPPFRGEALGKSWPTPGYRKAVAARARGGGEANDRGSEERRAAVRDAMKHAWRGYRKYAFGEDELEPVTKTTANDFGHLGATAIDAIDTLWIMGLEDEYKEAREVMTGFREKMMGATPLSTFECTIRLLGGFMSVYYLTGDKLFLDNARDLGDRLLSAYAKDGVGMPSGFISLKSLDHFNANWLRDNHLLAEFGTTQLEFYALSRETGDMKYAEASAKPLIGVHKRNNAQYLLSTHFLSSGEVATEETYTMGAMADSYYEYLLKAWVQAGAHRGDMVHDTGKRWEGAMDEMIKYLLYKQKSLSALIEVRGPLDKEKANPAIPTPNLDEMNHLACFAPGMLALGAHKAKDLLSKRKQDQYLRVAEDLTHTCYLFYNMTATGLAGETYDFISDKILIHDRHNMLRPEAVESLMILYRVTGKNKYREWGWEIFQAIEKHCKVEAGYSGVRDVTQEPAELDNKMQSWFLAETLKYLYLLFSPTDVVSLDEWVFNTEAHPLMIW